MGSEKDVSTQMRYLRVLYIKHTVITALLETGVDLGGRPTPSAPQKRRGKGKERKEKREREGET